MKLCRSAGYDKQLLIENKFSLAGFQAVASLHEQHNFFGAASMGRYARPHHSHVPFTRSLPPHGPLNPMIFTSIWTVRIQSDDGQENAEQ